MIIHGTNKNVEACLICRHRDLNIVPGASYRSIEIPGLALEMRFGNCWWLHIMDMRFTRNLRKKDIFALQTCEGQHLF